MLFLPALSSSSLRVALLLADVKFMDSSSAPDGSAWVRDSSPVIREFRAAFAFRRRDRADGAEDFSILLINSECFMVCLVFFLTWIGMGRAEGSGRAVEALPRSETRFVGFIGA